MSGPKTDGDLMNCCTANTGSTAYNNGYRYQSVNGQYTTCYNPEGIDSGNCPRDRTDKPIYACFPGSEQISNCRSSCLSGHNQDPNFKLNNPFSDAEIPIAERGVELYENYGLDLNIRSDSGLYGSDRSIFSCIGDLGRKVSLFGNIDFAININSNASKTVGTKKQILLPGNDVYYIITVNYFGSESSDITRYQYFGNNGVVFHYGGNDYAYIVGQMDNLPEVGIEIFNNFPQVVRISYYISSTLMMRRVLGVSSTATMTASSLNVVDGDINTPLVPRYNDAGCQSFNYVTTPSAAALFPPPWTDPWYMDPDIENSAWNCAGGKTGSGPQSLAGCYGSGVKSIYIPPHMAITSVSMYKIMYDSKGRITGSYFPSTESKLYTYEDSHYHNGTFPAIGSRTLPVNSTGVPTGRNSVFDMEAGTIYAVSVTVRQDDAFYNKYVKPVVGTFAPEIFLIPGISKGINFPGQFNPQGFANKLGDPIQEMQFAQDLWSSANPYWNGGKVIIDPKFNPGDVIFGPGDNPPLAGSKPHNRIFRKGNGGLQCDQSKKGDGSIIDKITKKIGDVIAADKAMIDLWSSKFTAMGYSISALTGQTEIPLPVGKYRIKRFSVINGVFSVEWLYVLYYCAMNGRNMVQYDPGSNSYVTANCSPTSTNSCGLECLLFRDDYTYKNPGSIASPADTAMSAYCGMRNLSYIYGTWQEKASLFTNECSCISQQNFCPVEFNGACSADPSNTNRYITSAMQTCAGAAICNYCSVSVNQILNEINTCGGGNSNVVKNFGTVCGNAECTYNITVPGDPSDPDAPTTPVVDPGEPVGGGEPSEEPSVPKSHNFIIIVVLLLILVAVVIAIVFIRKKYFHK
jgi:hypothetical protein